MVMVPTQRYTTVALSGPPGRERRAVLHYATITNDASNGAQAGQD